MEAHRSTSRNQQAAINSVRAAVMGRRVVRFFCQGDVIVCEPHLFGQARRTNAFWLKAYDRELEMWRYFPFGELKNFECLNDVFRIRPEFAESERKITVFDTMARLR